MPDIIADPGPSSEFSRVSNILGKIDKLALLEQVKSESDFIWDNLLIPYREDQLPEDELEADDPLKYVTGFLEEQERTLTETTPSRESILDDIHSGRTSPPLHIPVNNISKLFLIGETLGFGRAETTVEKVELHVSHKTPEIFAMKRMRKPAAPRNARRDLPPKTKSIVKEFKAERDNMRKCKHHHLVSFHASFTDQEYFGIIMSPVAESNLQQLLDNYIDVNQIYLKEREDDCKTLTVAFGCLLEAVRFLHCAKIRHRDLKPSNILLHDHRVLICDFGSTYDWGPVDRKESTEETQAGTRKYKAFEVLKDLGSKSTPSHNSKTDVFSLGCVFLEMHTVLKGMTLDKMAQKIMEDGTSSYGGFWSYASFLAGVKLWLEQLKEASGGLRQAPARLITKMLCENPHERDSADTLLNEVRNNYRYYIGECCKRSFRGIEEQPPVQDPMTDPMTGPMGYSTPRPIALYKIGLRYKDSSSSSKLEYSPYNFFAESREEGHLEIKEHCDGAPWMTTRSIIIRSSSLQELWLPAYFVLVTQDGCKVILKWSDCDQEVVYSKNRLTEFRKVHHSSSAMTNLYMEVEFRNESNAQALCTLLLREPTEGQSLCEMQLPHNKHLTVRSFQWETTGSEKSASGSGSHVLSIRYSPESRQYQRLESVFLPENLDFTWALDQARKHVKITIKPAWMPRYLSDQDPIYEGKNDRAICKCVELVAVSKEYSIEFHEGSEDSSTPRHVKNPQYIERVTYSFNHFLSTLTGLELLVAFSITTSPPGSWKKRPADVLCFRNRDDGVSRVAFRWKDSSGATTGWTTATLTKIVSTHNDKALLEVELAFRQDGQLLGLAGVAAIGGKRNSSTKNLEKWALQLESGSALPLKYNHSLYNLVSLIEPQR